MTLIDATAPTIKLNSNETTTTQLSFTITETAEEQPGTHLKTYYYIPGPDDDPEDENNPNRKELTGSSQTVTVNWTPDDNNNIVVCTFTKRVDDSDHTNYDVSKLAWQIFHNTGSNELPCLDEPVITPRDQAVFAKEFIVTIDHDQWKEDLSIKPEIYYRIEERNDDGGTIITKNWTKAPKLPLTLTLTKSSTVKAHAEFESSTKDVSRTYILLDESTTYVNKEERLDVGTTVEKNGMTMTYGGIQKDKDYFTRFSNIDNSLDNILGSLHAVTGTPLYSNLDAMSGKGVVSEKGSLYSHKQASNQALHDRTFSLPAIGSFFKFEPVANGELTVFVEQQGAMVKSQGDLDPTKIRKRIVYFLDETGMSIPATYAYTSSKINKSDWTSVKNTPVEGNDPYMTKLKKFYQDIIDGKNKTFPNINSDFSENSRENGLVLGESIQPIIVLHDECNKDILEEDGKYDKTGYMTISEGYVTYTFPVKAGKTYYLFASGTKLALSGFNFDRDDHYTPVEETLDAQGNNADKINTLQEGKQYNVRLENRTFNKNKWYAMVLPFSVSQMEMKATFGKDVNILHYNNVEDKTLNLTEHFYKMLVGGTPVLVKPSEDVKNPYFSNVTLTSKEVVAIEKSGFKCTGSWDNVDFPEYSYFINAKDNTFYLYDPTVTDKKPHAGAFRAWIISTSTNPAGAPQLNMRINGVEDNDETTAIWNAISADDDNAEVGSKNIYSLSGQKMNTTDTRSLPKGIYIVNGKKFIVK
ncbi:hypothetical protein [uncultured Prevotella sp.]|uniref:hypothetical protein n=1 Tax=uncultured Prevotella sp. TaxID=159272 RepID=UPI002803B0DF|nr:hypothetical protein [uncultured Prevotella sp.]